MLYLSKRKTLSRLLVVALVTLAIFVTVGFAFQGTQRFKEIIVQTLTVQNAATFKVAPTFEAGMALSGGNLDMANGIISNIGNAGTDFNAQGGLTTAAGITGTTLALNSVQQSGPVRFGAAQSAISGTAVTHGLGTTPTAILLTSVYTNGGFTRTAYVMASNTTVFTVGIEGGDGVPQGLYWMAGK